MTASSAVADGHEDDDAARPRRLGRVLAALALAALILSVGAWQAHDMHERADDIAEITRDIAVVDHEAQLIAMWLRAEDAVADAAGREALAPLAAAAMESAERLEARHDAALQAAWRAGLRDAAGDSVMEAFQRPAHQMDIMVRGFLRGVNRVAETSGERRAIARAELKATVDGALGAGMKEAQADLLAISERLRARSDMALGAACLAALLCLAFAGYAAAMGLAPAIGAAEERVALAESRVEEAQMRLRSAQRDRARMLDLSGVALTAAAERMEGAADLLSRTPLSDTQLRVLAGLRHALSEQLMRLDGLRMLCAHGDGRLRLAARRSRPGAALAEWLDAARARAAEDGRMLLVDAAPDGELELLGDSAMLTAALDRMLEDALRRVGKGGAVHLSARLETADEARAELEVRMEHSAPPPGPSETAAARDPFTERPPSTNAMPKGSDPFGLAVAAAICSAAGGGLEVSGDAESGAVMTARFRFARRLTAEPAAGMAETSGPAAPDAEAAADAAFFDPVTAGTGPGGVDRRTGPARRRADRPSGEEAENPVEAARKFGLGGG